MQLAQTHYDNSETGCCARLDADEWNEREFTWDEKPFLKDHVRSFLHVPLNYGQVITRDLAMVEEAEAYPMEPLTLNDDVSPWSTDVYVAVDRDIPGANMVYLSGTFLTKVFEGPYSHAGRWAKEMEAYVRSKGRDLKKLYFYYATCPKCAKQFGKNSVVVFAQVA